MHGVTNITIALASYHILQPLILSTGSYLMLQTQLWVSVYLDRALSSDYLPCRPVCLSQVNVKYKEILNRLIMKCEY